MLEAYQKPEFHFILMNDDTDLLVQSGAGIPVGQTEAGQNNSLFNNNGDPTTPLSF